MTFDLGKLLTSDDLAKRWSLNPLTPAQWRVRGVGPRYVKLGRKVRYRLEEIEEYERKHLVRSTAESPAP